MTLIVISGRNQKKWSTAYSCFDNIYTDLFFILTPPFF